MFAPVKTERLVLRRPTADDAERIFRAYATDLDVTRYLSWPTHVTLDDTRAFLAWSDASWDQDGYGPLLIERREGPDDERLLGSTGLDVQTPTRAAVGYLLAKRAWGQGFASEALAAMIDEARRAKLWRLEALCHVDHEASAHVLLKAGFAEEGILRAHTVFPNHTPYQPADVRLFSRVLRS